MRATETLMNSSSASMPTVVKTNYDEDHAGETAGGIWRLPFPPTDRFTVMFGEAPPPNLPSRHIAVHPTLGWWRTRPGEHRYDNTAHYSLIVTISTPGQTVDIYTPVAIELGIGVPSPSSQEKLPEKVQSLVRSGKVRA